MFSKIVYFFCFLARLGAKTLFLPPKRDAKFNRMCCFHVMAQGDFICGTAQEVVLRRVQMDMKDCTS